MRKLIALTMAGFCVSAGGQPGSGGASDDEITAEAVGSVAVCAVCHGATGKGSQALNAPRIGGLDASYITRQLELFRTGTRGGTEKDPYGTQMRAIALALDNFDATAEDLGHYFAELEPAAAPNTVRGDVARGEELYAVCAACHGQDGRGVPELNAPSLIEQSDWYIVRQLEHYRDGLRGSDPQDTLGTQMVPIVNSLPDDDAFDDIVAYINTL
jgi:cytochrome c oxidase subunit 2